MKITNDLFELFSDKAIWDSSNDIDLEVINGIIIRAVKKDNWRNVVIVVDENARHEDIKSAIPKALEWRDFLIGKQGFPESGYVEILNDLLSLHKDKVSYSNLAERINNLIANLLREHFENEKAENSKNMQIFTQLERARYILVKAMHFGMCQ